MNLLCLSFVSKQLMLTDIDNAKTVLLSHSFTLTQAKNALSHHDRNPEEDSKVVKMLNLTGFQSQEKAKN